MLLLLPLLFACCSPFTVDPIYRPNHYRAYFKRNWGMKQLEKLRGCEAHSSVILSHVDEDLFKKLGVNITFEPKYQAKKLFHKN